MSDAPRKLPRHASPESWQRWQMKTFEYACVARNTEATVAQPGDESRQLRDELESAREQTRARAQAEGYAAGHAQGLAAGMLEGQEIGGRQGYESGFRNGHAAGQAQTRQEAARLRDLTSSCATAIASLENEMGQALIGLALHIARHMLHSTLEAHPEKILDLVRDIVHVDQDKEAALHLRLHPQDLALVESGLVDEPGFRNWRLTGDESIEPGGCRVETALGNIDATLATRWQRVAAALGHPLDDPPAP